MGDDESVNLPPGFRFEPSDEEIILNFLYPRAARLPCYPDIIPHLHPHPCDPWQLPGKALWSGSKWYYLSQKTEERRTRNGYWEEAGDDKPIFTSSNPCKKAGKKKSLDYFYTAGEVPAGEKTNWRMYEYHLSSSAFLSNPRKTRANHEEDISRWALCCVEERNDGYRGGYYDGSDGEGADLSSLDEVFLSMDDDQDEIS